MPFSFNGWEIFLLLVLAILIFGPDKLPDLARKTARVIHFLRNVANNATAQVRNELGPEYANLELRDLHPKAMVQRELDNLGLEDVRADIASAAGEVRATAHEARGHASDLRATAARGDADATHRGSHVATAPGDATPYDTDAT